MLRTAASRISQNRRAMSVVIPAPAVVASSTRLLPTRLYARCNSSTSNPNTATAERRQAARGLHDDLQKDWSAPVVSYEQLKPKTEAPRIDAYLIDVREPDEVIQGSIPSSVNLPLSVLATSLHLDPLAFKEKHAFDKPKKDQEITFYCRSGKRSASAADIARRNGFTEVHNYVGSWLDWVEREGKKSS